jgi:hypothetical protein
MTDRGIDYGLGRTNIDLETGIRYGVICIKDLNPDWSYEAFEPEYGDPSCPNCGGSVCESCDTDADNAGRDYFCGECDESFWSDHCFPESPIANILDDGEYKAQLDEYNDIFLFESPYYTLAQFCSPCAPGAGHLGNPTPNGVKTYCLGHDWFEGGKAPYPVYCIKTGKLINP